MQGFVIALREDGLFEVISSLLGVSSVRVAYNGASPHAPWTPMMLDETGVRWVPTEGFDSLDNALEYAMIKAHGWDTIKQYEVHLPDGLKFKRPGRFGIEQVMVSAGWAFVTELIGFSMLSTSKHASIFDARSKMLERIHGSTVQLGEVNPVDEDEANLFWCADLRLPFEGFVQYDRIETEARIAFASEGVEVIPHFDYRTQTTVSHPKASVIPFPEDRIVRKLTAA